MAINRNNIVRYAVFPGIIPRLKLLFGSGFSYFASLIAVLYYNIGLIPAGHKYLDADNFGKFGIRHVIAEAGNNLTYSRKHVDQIILYYTTLAGLALLVIQIILLGISLISSPVIASTWYNMFVTTPTGHTSAQDIAFVVLDNIFGIKAFSGSGSALGFFNSCISDLSTPCENIRGTVVTSPTSYPLPMHIALHKMLYFYNLGIAFVAGLIIIYFIVAIIGETITTGTPFGQRLNKAWFIPRLILFFALIAPVSVSGNNQGISVAQMIVFSAAKFGSNMATNAWLQFNDNAIGGTTEFLGQQRGLLARPNVPEIGGFTQFMHVARMCMYAQKVMNGIDVKPYVVREHSEDTTSVRLHTGTNENYNAMGGTTDDYLDLLSTTFLNAVIFSRYKTVVVRFGHHNPPGGNVNDLNDPPGSYENEWGNVEPTCGEVHFEISSLDPHVIGTGGAGVVGIQEIYFWSIFGYLQTDPMVDTTSYCMVRSALPYDIDNSCTDDTYNVTGLGSYSNFPYTDETNLITTKSAKALLEKYNSLTKYYLAGEETGWGSYAFNPAGSVLANMDLGLSDSAYVNNLLMPPEIWERGWAAAALWYNKIAEINGIAVSATLNMPKVFKYPKVMEEIALQHKENDYNPSYEDRFNPRLQNNQLASLPGPTDQYLAAVLYNNFNFWKNASVQQTVHTKEYKNSILDYINTIFGTNGLVNIMENDGTHPLAMLSATGKAMVDASLRNLFAGVVGQGLGAILSDTFLGDMAKVASGFIVQFSLITLSIGFMLYYILPFMPFIYFFFAFSGWIKSIFEAIVAMPLWALAHIKTDGEGLSGPWASNGYFLIFEIFLRPTLIIFGFLASIALFTALVDVFHDIFHQLTLVATGYDIEQEIFSTPIDLISGTTTMNYWRSPLDELFYTGIYTIIVYMIAMSCFKLIDQIPNNIMRWMGVTVSTFQENAGDPAGELTGKMYRSTQMANAQITQMVARIKGGSSSAVQDAAVIMTPPVK